MLAIPSSLAGINEFTNFFELDKESHICKTGIKDGWYKNCEYKFQFDLPTDNWLFVDSNDETVFEPMYSSDEDYWLDMEYVYGADGTTDSYISIIINDMRDFGYISFVDYKRLQYDAILNATEYTNVEYYAKDNFFEVNYNIQDSYKKLSCYEKHQKNVSLIYVVLSCVNEEGVDIDIIQNDIYRFWKTFRFL